MNQLGPILDRLTPKHRRALGWFLENQGKTVAWPKPIDHEGEPLGLAITAMGIYKPQWTKYALSVWQSLRGAYPDQEPVHRPDGSWVYAYYQQNKDPDRRDEFFTNRGLVQCMAEGVPIGVFRQTKAKPSPRYQILGLALVSNWDGGFFFLEGFSQDRRAHPRGPEAEMDFFRAMLDRRKEEHGQLDPTSLIDARRRIVATIVQREGQPEFRRTLLEAYQNRCAVTGYDAPRALEAAHIVPYRGPRTNEPSNGLLLRGDVHTLFDCGLVAVDTKGMKLIIKESLERTAYRGLIGQVLLSPHEQSARPSKELLDRHRVWAGF